MKKLKVWDSNLITDTYVLLKQMQVHLEDLGEKLGIQSLKDLPDSMIPTSSLYEITACYEIIYDKLVEYELLEVGGTKDQSKNIH